MNITHGAPRCVGIATVAVVTALCIAACGSSSSSTSSAAKSASASTGTTGRAALAACLKQHGVTLPSRPGGFRPGAGAPGGGAPGTGPAAGSHRGGGFFGAGGGARGHFNSKFATAFKACGAKFGGAGRFRGGAAFSHAKISQYVTCIRQHGYNMPSPNFSGKGSVFPAKIRTNKKFLAASKSCTKILVPARPGGASSTSATSSS